jgi:hypothetical protein
VPQLTARLRTPWGASAALWGELLTTPWGVASALWSTGGAYTPPPPPAGGTPVAPSTAARITVPTAAVYDLVHTLQVTDLRTNAALPVDSVSIATDRDSAFWRLRATGGAELMAALSAGEQPARVRVVVDGAEWDFLVEAVTRSRRHVATEVAVEGRSLSAAAGSPYEPERQWALEGDTTGAQLAAAANLFTELDVQFELDDWPVPAGVFSFTGTPLGVVQRVAEAAGGMVISQRKGYGVIVRPRYAVLPNEWPEVSPDLELPLSVLDNESFRVADQPPYDGVVVSGQQQGVVGLVRLAGTSGGFQAPMVTDSLITDVIAARQRGQAVLGQGGKQQLHTVTLPVVSVAGAAVVPQPGWLVRVADSPAWVGLVTGLQLDAQVASAVLTLTLERHTELIEGTVVAPPIEDVLAFAGPIPNLQVAPGAAVDVPLAGYWVDGEPPLAYSLRSGALPAWLTLNTSTGRLLGTAPGAPETSAPLAVRATDAIDSTADSNEFAVQVAPSFVDVVRATFEGVNGQTTGVQNLGAGGGLFTLRTDATISTAAAAEGASSLRVVTRSFAPANGTEFLILQDGFDGVELKHSRGQKISVEFRVRVEGSLSPDNRTVFTFRLQRLNAEDNNALDLLFHVGMRTNANDVRIQFRGGTALALIGTVGETQDGGPGLSKSVFHHLAISLDDSSVYRAFVNGSPVSNMPPVVQTFQPGAAIPMRLAVFDGGFITQFSGRVAYIDNIRIRQNFAYVAPFTPDTII